MRRGEGRERFHNVFMPDAYVTVLFSMIFLTVISVVLVAVETVRVSAVRLQAEIACSIAAEAFLSQYQPEVQARYGLYLVERDGYDLLFLQDFIEENCSSGEDEADVGWLDLELESVVIEEDIEIQAEDYAYLEEQITDLMIAVKGSSYVEELFADLLGLSNEDVEEEKEDFLEDLEETGEEAQQDQEAYEEAAALEAENSTDGEGNIETEEGNSEVTEDAEEIEDPREAITQLLKYPIANLVMEGEISSAELDTSELSEYVNAESDVSQLQGFLDYEDVTEELEDFSFDLFDSLSDLGDEFIVDCYILDYFTNAAQADESQEQSVLAYEAEYILCGNEEDAANLQNTINRISLIRMILNLSYLMGSQTKTAAARTVAVSLSTALLMPFLEEIIYLLILSAWAYAEALVDCRCLLEGGKVPLVKSDSTWTLSLTELSEIGQDQINQCAQEADDESGWSYEDYLRLLLQGVSQEKKYVRMLNLMEVNIRHAEGCEEFCMADCVFGITICADFEFDSFFFSSTQKDSYEHHVRKSIAY